MYTIKISKFPLWGVTSGQSMKNRIFF
uniref:Uncharacterized protein n=1 Tax=Anguilla anguilla TaxID=7936 RepID=A0A0E9TIF9_ANGAN